MIDIDKILWGGAPSWAEWHAVDEDGSAMFFETQPRPSDAGCPWWARYDAGRFIEAGQTLPPKGDWRMSLSRRPQLPAWASQETSPTGELPNTSVESYASDPSQEYRFTWWEPSSSDYGQWRKTREEALSEANENYMEFQGGLSGRTVYIVECVLVASAPPHAEDAL